MGLRLNLAFYGDVQLDRELADIQDRVRDMRPVWDVLADRFAVIERAQFATEGRYGSGGWQALSPRYARWKARTYPGKPILQREGDLVASLTERPFGIEVLEENFMVLGSDVEYGRYHQNPEVAGRPPQRRPIELPESERVDWVRTMQRFVVTGKT